MFTLAVVLAVVAALLIAVGAVMQQGSAARIERSPGARARVALSMLSDLRWVAGGVLAGTGVGLHIVALSNGPVSVIQPLGSVGLFFAVVVKAVTERSGMSRARILGCVAVIAGLAGLLLALPHHSGTSPLGLPKAALLAAPAIGIVVASVILAGRPVPSLLKAGVLALGAGTSFGVAAAVIGVIGRRVGHDVLQAFQWPTLVAVVLLACGILVQQYAYRLNHFSMVYAVLLVADPVTAAFTGVLALGDPVPSAAPRLAFLAVSAVITVTGIVVLAAEQADSLGMHRRMGHAHSDRD